MSMGAGRTSCGCGFRVCRCVDVGVWVMVG